MDATAYLTEALRRDPNSEAASIIALRNQFLQLESAPKPKPQQAENRERVTDLLSCLHRHFWQDEADMYLAQLQQEAFDAFPHLKQRYTRLTALYPLRETFAQAGHQEILDVDLLKFYGQIVIAERRYATHLKDLFTETLHIPRELIRVKQWIRVLRAQYSSLYQLEAHWLDNILESKSHHWRTPKKRHVRYGYWLPVGLTVLIVLSTLVFLLIMGAE